MEDIRKNVSELTNQVVDFANKMESDDSLAKGIGALEILNLSTAQYDKKEYYALFSGEVKTGKSSLINSILGEDVCTVDGGVCTNTNTMIRYGEKEKITVYFAPQKDGDPEPNPITIERSQIDEFVSEKKNKNNKKNARLIVVELPNKHLKTGLVLLDTPGLGSLNPMHTATTFSMAPIADVIFLVSSSESELTASEVSYIKQLFECSKSKRLVHVLTHMDQGEPTKILEKNKQHLNSEINFEGYNLQHCMVSNKNLIKYRDGIIKDFSTTGFDVLFAMMEKLEESVEMIMAKRQLECIEITLDKYSSVLNTLLQSFTSPEKAAEQRNKIEEASKRLKDIKDNTNIWKIKLNGELAKLKIRANNRIKEDFEEIKRDIENKLQMDEFLKNPNQLGGFVSAEVVKKNAKLQDYLTEEFASVYGWLKNETKLSLIQEELNHLGNSDNQISVDGVFKIDKAVIYRNTYASNVFVGTAAGAIVGGIVGGIIGTFFAPGVGTIAGAELGAAIASAIGAVIGSIVSFFKSKEKVKQEKRNKILNAILPKLNKAQSNITTQVSQIITEGETQLFIAFSKELDSDINRCSNIIKGLDSDSIKRKQIVDLEKDCKKHQAQTLKLLKEIQL